MTHITLTNEQKKVVEHFGSPSRVLAGPGTGKTFCIAEKIKKLITEHKIPSNNICAITFTNAAAGELRHKLEKTGVKSDLLPYVNTLHGFAMGILRSHFKRAGLKAGFRPVYGVMQRVLIRDVVEDLKHKNLLLTRTDVKNYMYAHLQEKSKAGIPSHLSSKPLKMKALKEFSKHYHENLEFYNAVDWADVLHKAIELIGCYKDIRSKTHTRTQHLLVDEYQDLSPLEQEFVDKICGDSSGLCVVGDDDQCIYETFRFAAPQGIIDFPKKYKNAKLLYITLCHRCPPVIIENALKLIVNNKKRVHEKFLKPFDKDKKGFLVTLRKKSKKSEIEWLVSKIHNLIRKDYQYKDILILFTDGKIAKDYVIALKAADIPLDVQLTVSNIFVTENFIWLTSTIQWLINNNDNLSMRQCLDYAKGVGVETIRQLRLLALASDNASLWNVIENVALNTKAFSNMRQRKKVGEFYKYLTDLKSIENFSGIVETFFSYTIKSREDKGCNELLSHFKKFDGQEKVIDLKDIFEDFQQQIDSGELENKYKKEPTKVRVMSMHSAKGCESPIVFVPALEDDIIPGVYANSIEEKRRLFYVSLTRAKVGAYLTWAGQRTGQEIHMHNRKMFDKKISRFLEEISDNKEN